MRAITLKEHSPSVEELARLQGVKPVKRLEDWLMQLPADEPEADEDDLYTTVMRLRRELREAEKAEQ